MKRMALEDPDIQKGLLYTIAAAFAGALWWIKRRVGLVDDLETRVGTIEKDYVTRTYLDDKMNGLSREIRDGHRAISRRVDDIYREMPKRKQDE